MNAKTEVTAEIISDVDYSIQEYWLALKRHKWGIITLSFLITVLTTLIVFSMKPVYQSTTTLLIAPDKNNVVSIKEVYGLASNDYFTTQSEILKSRVLISKVIKETHLINAPELQQKNKLIDLDWRSWVSNWIPNIRKEYKSTGIDKLLEQVIVEVGKRLKITPIKATELVKISFESNDRILAAKVANTLAETYIQSDFEAKLKLTEQASSWLDARLETLKSKLHESETALQKYREKEGLLETTNVGTLASSRLQELQTKLILTHQQRVAFETSLQQVKALKGKSIDQFSTLPAVLNDKLFGELKKSEEQSQRTVKTLSKRYGPRHPKLIQARADLKAAVTAVNKRIGIVIESMQKSFLAAKKNEQSLLSSINFAKNDMQKINRQSYQLGVLTREVASNKKLFELFLTRSKETKQIGLIKPGARIVDPATPSLNPIKPKKKLIIMIAGTLGLLFGILVAIQLERLDNTLKRSGDLEAHLQLVELGTLPHLKLKERSGENPVDYMLENTQSYFAESIRTIRTGILLSGLDDPYKVVMVTSSVPGEGKSTVAACLAKSLSELNKVLLIDADMRRPTVASTWGIDKTEPGLSNFIAGLAKISKCMHRINGSNIYVMTAGVIPPNPVELLSSKRFGDLLRNFSKIFDTIVIDTAPTLAVSDALVVSQHTTGILYVVKAESTPMPAVKEGIKRLRRNDVNIIGGILNDIPHGQKKGNEGYYNYNYGYTGSYEGYHHD